MASSFSRELEDLLNPLPKFADPEDDGDEATKARVIDPFNEDQDPDEDGTGLSALRKHTSSVLLDTDKRYVGKAVSRKQLLVDIGGSGEEEEEDEEEEERDEQEEEGEDDEEQEGSVEGLDEEGDASMDEEADDDDDDDDDDLSDEEVMVDKAKGDMSFPQGLDFHKLTEGMDDLGVSEDDVGDDEDDSDDDDDDESDAESGGSDEDSDDKGEDDGAVRTFSKDKVDEEVEKGRAVKNQLALWDQLLEGRIKLQKALATANRLPQPDALPEFKRRGGAELAGALKNTHKALKALQRSLLELHDQLLWQGADTRPIAMGEDGDEEIDSDGDEPVPERAAPKRKLEMAEYPAFMSKRFAAFRPYCDATLQKWHDKTRLTMGKSSKGFGAFERNMVTQVEQVLMDKERLLRRTQTRRTEYRVLGKREASAVAPETTAEEGEGQQQPAARANAHLKDLDEDVFDDDDFYHQLLRELIERKTSAVDPNDQVAMGRQWLAIQKLRSKIKRKVDTKASKGRKVRFHVHSKLVNFMAPMDHSSMSDEARNELYRGLFGQNTAARE